MSVENEETIGGASRLFAGGGILASLGGLLGASCCVLPLALVNLGVSSAIVANLGFFVGAQPWFAGAAALLVAAGFISAFWRGRRPRPRLFAMLGVAAVLVAATFLAPAFERELLQWMNRP